MTTYIEYSLIARDMPTAIQRVSEDNVVSRDTEYYKENIGNVKSIEEFLADDRLFNYAMKAHGLEEMTYAKGLIRKVLEGGVDDDDALANQFTDTRYADFADAFDFNKHGETATIFTSAQQDTIDKYLQQSLEEEAGESNQGVRLALYFERKMPEIMDEESSDLSIAYEILADNALADVVRTTLGIAPETATADIDIQADMILERLNLEDLNDPEEMSKFMERFTAMWEINNPTGGYSSAAQLVGSSAGYGLSADLMMSLNSLKLGGS